MIIYNEVINNTFFRYIINEIDDPFLSVRGESKFFHLHKNKELYYWIELDRTFEIVACQENDLPVHIF